MEVKKKLAKEPVKRRNGQNQSTIRATGLAGLIICDFPKDGHGPSTIGRSGDRVIARDREILGAMLADVRLSGLEL
jgi:hypothetical protein